MDTPRATHHPNYIGIFVALTVLTVIEVAVAYAPIVRGPKILGLVAMAITKALLVALYYMHLKFDKRLVILVALMPFVLISIVCLLLFIGISVLR